VMARPGAARDAEAALAAHGAEVFRVPAPDGRLDLAAVLRFLAERGITRLMVEGGPVVAAAFLRAGLIDECALLRSPATIGADGIDALDGMPLSALTHGPRLQRIAVEPVGDDVIEHFVAPW
jgi:diaminohydroxyphosphoribosylaminopyrimidine deaminase / 5-amino-6-(5-phosphoribosylamino)uracil reductase